MFHNNHLFPFTDSRSQKRGGYSSQKSRDREYSKKDKYSGDWSEHVSSSGKKYYYNCKTEVSQWEKPREWLDKERSVFERVWKDNGD